LILDIRLNYGGSSLVDDDGLSLLFNSYITTIAMDGRCGNRDDHFKMCSSSWWTSYRLAIKGNPMSFYDRPIAVLTGPGAQSMGDQLSLKMKYHPMARLFGKSPAGAFSAWSAEYINLGFSDWMFACTIYNAYLVSNPGIYLTHTDLPVDEEVWLIQEDVAKGEDTVVKRAIEWIQNLAYAHDVTVDKTYLKPGIDSVLITATVENPNQHNLSVEAVVRNIDSTVTDNFDLFDDGMHGDGDANDNQWGNFYQPTDEQSYKISVTTNDNSEETSRTLPNVAWFTTIGPVVFNEYKITGNFFNTYYLKLSLRNDGQEARATDILVELTQKIKGEDIAREERRIFKELLGKLENF